MYIVYEKGTGKVERVLMLEQGDPKWKDIATTLINPDLYSGFSVADNMEVLNEPERFEIKKDALGRPYLFRHKFIALHFSGDWAIARKWQRIICEDKATKFTIHFKDETGKSVPVSGELRLDGMNFIISDANINLRRQTEVSIMVTGRFPCQTQLKVRFYPTSHVFHRLDRDANEGRPVIRNSCMFNIVNKETFLKWGNQSYYDLQIMTPDSDGDGIKDIIADGNSTAMCTVYKRNAKGNIIKDNDLVRITTTRGRLSKEKLQLVDGVGTFYITSSVETVTSQIRVDADKGDKVVYGNDEIHFRL